MGPLRPQFSDAAWPGARLVEPVLDVGQVEVDQLLLNLTTFEAFFPENEQRPASCLARAGPSAAT